MCEASSTPYSAGSVLKSLFPAIHRVVLTPNMLSYSTIPLPPLLHSYSFSVNVFLNSRSFQHYLAVVIFEMFYCIT